MNSTITANRVHTENPTCSANTDQYRLRIAVRRPPDSHRAVSSGSQSSITCERVISLSLPDPGHLSGSLWPPR